MGTQDDVDRWRESLRSALVTAMRARDQVAVRTLRSALGAIDNAEAPDTAHAPEATAGTIAGGVSGLGTGEVPRLVLSDADVASILRNEIAVRQTAAGDYELHGRVEAAASLRAEAAVLEIQLTATARPTPGP